MALGLFGTLALIAVLGMGVILTTPGRQPPTPTPTRVSAEVVPATLTPTPSGPTLPPPTETPAPPTATPTPTGPVIHVIQSGDTLFGIALDYGVTLEDLLRANNLENENVLLSIGQELIIPINPPPPEPTAEATATPAAAASGSGQGAAYACPSNAAERPLTLPGDPIRLILSGGQAFFVADGNLYTAALGELAGSGPLAPSNTLPPERKIGPYTIRELVYAATDPATGDLIVMDKSDDIYRRTTSGEWRMEIAAAPIPGQYPDPQYLAVQAFGGNVYALDADLSRIWKFTPSAATPIPYYAGGDVSTGMDMVIPASGAVIVLTRDGRAIKFAGGQRDATFSLPTDVGRIAWPGQVLATDQHIVVVDSQARRVIGLDAASGQVAWQVTFRFPGMQRLRSAAVAGDTLYAVAGRNLYAVKLGSSGADCPAVTYDDTLYFDGVDVRASLAGFKMPFEGAILPDRPRSYPGARRLYRYGVHQGVDLYGVDVAGLGVGSPVLAIADGAILRADADYVEMTRQEYDDVVKRTEAEHQTPPDLFDKLLGRQVRISHGFGVESWYAHLSAIAPGVARDSTVRQGAPVGNVGVSGTSAGAYGTEEGAHLHFEIWINGRYLGQGLSLYETMRLWQAVFEG